ncbi:MAG: pilus assembly protein PilP [Nitrospirae bacterium]|nr:pilus assembly protein PilP [Nitrospirota bacterium]
MSKIFLALLIILLPLGACKKETPRPAAQQKGKAQPQAAPAKTEPAALKPVSQKAEPETYHYNPQGRRDPFLSIIESSKREREAEKKRKGLKPAEAFDVSDIRLIAIAKDRHRFYAMLQLPNKKYFTVREGTSVGLYGGKVIKITPSTVVVREYITNYKGEVQPKDTILKLRKEEGE